ncbi:hypothetical protein SDC9_133637 [bioreactor metagenome]|uniref:Uncharacterized protein n=1 Tax=bioreactor metagenome TaxID=1076179 RepID=A0A645DC08_9ZZZZ
MPRFWLAKLLVQSLAPVVEVISITHAQQFLEHPLDHCRIRRSTAFHAFFAQVFEHQLQVVRYRPAYPPDDDCTQAFVKIDGVAPGKFT